MHKNSTLNQADTRDQELIYLYGHIYGRHKMLRSGGDRRKIGTVEIPSVNLTHDWVHFHSRARQVPSEALRNSWNCATAEISKKYDLARRLLLVAITARRACVGPKPTWTRAWVRKSTVFVSLLPLSIPGGCCWQRGLVTQKWICNVQRIQREGHQGESPGSDE